MSRKDPGLRGDSAVFGNTDRGIGGGPERQPEPDLSHARRAWHDAESCYRSSWFYVPVAAAATVATVAGAVLQEKTSTEVEVILAIASAAGVPMVAGTIVLVVMLVLAPGRRREDKLKARIDRLEASSSFPESSRTTIYAPKSHFYFGDERAIRELPILRPDDKG